MTTRRHFVLFDLDGTLVPLSRTRFEKALFQSMDEMFRRSLPDPATAETVKRAMISSFQGGGDVTNEMHLNQALHRELGGLADEVLQALERYYATDYNQLRSLIQDVSIAEEALSIVEAHHGIPVLATNPISPASCIHARLGWIGIAPERFRLVTTYDKCCYAKPDPRFYLEVLEMLQADASECIMIGNDTDEDIEAAMAVGIETYLMTDYVMDRRDSVAQYRHGTGREMLEFLKDHMKG